MNIFLKAALKNIFFFFREVIIAIALFPIAMFSRFQKKKIDVGLGPHPLINNVYHKIALEKQGYSAETFTFRPYYITSKFDVVLSERYDISSIWGLLKAQVKLVIIPFKYRILYIYFNGGSLGQAKIFLWRLEPFFYKIAGIKTVIMPYGSDVQEMSRCNNLYFKHTMTLSYPDHKVRRKHIAGQIDLWTKYGDHVLGGCEWVDYMYHWDTLMISHFSIDTEIKGKTIEYKPEGTFKVLHAPNHRALKGTDFLIKAIEALKTEGLDIELVMLEKVSNEKVIELIQEVDLVADQFIIGWYAMFAIEAMKHKKPVLCYLRQDLIDLYTGAGLIQTDEIPMINTHWTQIQDNIRTAYNEREKLIAIGEKSREYVVKRHSTEYIGSVFATINKDLIGK
jgi:glycosyltransferase involved in cell wall biosynthesis